ncbi:MAG: hypothetical protein IKG21_06475 [Atopobiaceae bacterium]|nr:hypothetical protein [Atopobiaceae bacterium]
MSRPTIRVEGGKRRASKPGPLGVSALVLLSAASEGLDRAHQRLVSRLYRRGETKDSLIRTVEEYPLPSRVKGLVATRMTTSDDAEPSGIEVESIVEVVDVTDVTDVTDVSADVADGC